MPCFSANNLRFAGSQHQQQKHGSNERSLTSLRTSSEVHSLAIENNEPFPRNIRQQCDNLFQSKQTFQRKSAQPTAKHTSQQTILPLKELQRLKTASKVISLEERLDALLKQEQETKRLDKEADQTRLRFKEIDDARKKALNSNVDEDAHAADKLKVLERAFIARHEQEEEVKRVNRIILNAKCHAIRDAQIQEKKDLERGLKEEDTRLEKTVLERAMKQLNEEDDKFEKQKLDRQQYAREIKQQLSERENLRFLEAERLEEEAKLLRSAHEAIKEDDRRQLQLQRERRLKFRTDMAKVAEMSSLFKKILCEQEKNADMRVASYMREKKEREDQLKAEKKVSKEAFERKQQRLYILAQKIFESKSQREEMAYLREQEKIERDYRRKEKEAAMHKRQVEKELSDARETQLQEMKQRQALQLARSEKEFALLVKSLKKEEVYQNKLNEDREKQRKCYRMAIMRQMGDKEMERRRLIELEKSQANAWRESERQRNSNIRAIIKAKLNAMREACLPEKYIKEVEKHLKKIDLAPFSMKID